MLRCKPSTAGLRIGCLFLLLLAGCASGPQTRLSAGEASRIRTIALLYVAEPKIDQVLNVGSSNESHSSTYAEMLADRHIEFSPLLAEAITRQLDRSHYRAVYLYDRPVPYRADGALDLTAVDSDVDAVLYVQFRKAGYVSSSPTNFKPWAVVQAQLFDKHTGQLLYAKTFDAGYDSGETGAAHLATNVRYQYSSIEQLTGDVEETADGIRDAVLAIAGAIGQDFAIGTRPVDGYAVPITPPVSSQTAAERDREAAAALAAQWSQTEPVTVPESPAPASPAPEPATAAGASTGNAVVAPEAIGAAVPGGKSAVSAVMDDTGAAGAPTSAIDRAAPAGTVSQSTVAAAPPGVQRAVRSSTLPYGGIPVTITRATPVRASPTDRAQVIATLLQGTTAARGSTVIHNASGDWCYIEQDSISGWVPVDATQP